MNHSGYYDIFIYCHTKNKRLYCDYIRSLTHRLKYQAIDKLVLYSDSPSEAKAILANLQYFTKSKHFFLGKLHPAILAYTKANVRLDHLFLVNTEQTSRREFQCNSFLSKKRGRSDRQIERHRWCRCCWHGNISHVVDYSEENTIYFHLSQASSYIISPTSPMKRKYMIWKRKGMQSL